MPTASSLRLASAAAIEINKTDPNKFYKRIRKLGEGASGVVFEAGLPCLSPVPPLSRPCLSPVCLSPVSPVHPIAILLPLLMRGCGIACAGNRQADEEAVRH